MLSYLQSHPEVYAYLHDQGARFANQLNELFAANKLSTEVWHADSILSLRLRPRPAEPGPRDPAVEAAWGVAEDAVQLKLLDRGVIVPGAHQFYLSAAHSADDVNELIRAFGDAVLEARTEGWFPDGDRTT